MTAPRTQGRVRGFSLLEALVAMAIASIAFAALYRTVGQSSKTAVDVDARVQAAMLASSVLASATFAEDLLKQPAGDAHGWQWSVRVAPVQVPVTEQGHDPIPALRAAAVQIEVARDGRNVLTWSTWKPYRSAP
ncbi:MAG: type II secretion system protein [Proteobacteria bacterium]|nr:type II secretion system protein [Pseudomonadota bacterium]